MSAAGSTGLLGRVEEFDDSKEDWPQYVERVRHFFVANGIKEAERMRATFLSLLGSATYKTLRNLMSPDKPGDKSYEELVKVLSKHFKPTPSETVERFKFHSRFRKAGESVATFVSELRSLSEFCNFVVTLEAMLRDRLVCGINDAAIQKRLLAEPSLSYEKAVELSLAMERTAQNIKELRVRPEEKITTQPRQQEVYQVTRNPSAGHRGTKSSLTCYRCGNKGHSVTRCRVSKDAVCHHCGKLGHLQRVCSSKKGAPPRTGKCVKTRTVCQVQEGEESNSEDDSSTLFHVKVWPIHLLSK